MSQQASKLHHERQARIMVTNDQSHVWKIHGERIIDDTRKLNLSIASVEMPSGARFEQYVIRMPKAAITAVVDDSWSQVLMIWRHRWIMDSWTWELPGGYVDPHEDPAETAAREVLEETGWKPRKLNQLCTFQPLAGSADFENVLFLSEGADKTRLAPDENETARVDWIPLDSVMDEIASGRIIGAGTQIAIMHLLYMSTGRI